MTSRFPPRHPPWLECLLAGTRGREPAALVLASGAVEVTGSNVAPLGSGRLTNCRCASV